MRNIFRHLFISVALTVSAMSYCNAANTRATEQQDTIQHLDTTVIVAETDSLKLYKPIFYGGIGLRCARLCRPSASIWIVSASDGKLAPANTATPAWRPFAARNSRHWTKYAAMLCALRSLITSSSRPPDLRLEYPQFIGLNFVVYLISLCRTDVLSSKNLKKRFLVCTTVIIV